MKTGLDDLWRRSRMLPLLAMAGCGCEETGEFSSTSIDSTGDESILALFEERMTVFSCSSADADSAAGPR